MDSRKENYSDTKSYLVKTVAYQDIKRIFLDYVAKQLSRKELLEYTWFFEKKVYPLLNEKEKENINYRIFYQWAKTLEKYAPDLLSSETLLERETLKQKQQIKIRQDATDMMADFLYNIKTLIGKLDEMTPKDLQKMGIKPMDIYKIIREEEDRAKGLKLKERSENRADAHFALLISMVKADQLDEEDIQFLQDDIKKELIIFKKTNGIYQLGTSEQLGEAGPPAEDSSAESVNRT